MKALVLFSGGLDSVITVKLLQEQNIYVDAIYIENGFNKKSKLNYLREITSKLKINLIYVPAKKDFFEMWKSPKYSYGKGMNPCVDCHALMINTAQRKYGQDYDFIATGEVIDQRGKSQTTTQLPKVIKLLDKPDNILRPLSAKLLPETKMEKLGWVNRENLLSIQGKSRKIQLELLKKYGLSPDEVESPGGGCLMAEKSMKIKCHDFDIKKLDFSDFDLFKYGRHLKYKDHKLILTRNQEEYLQLKEYNGDNFIKIIPTIKKAPIGFIENNIALDENTKKDIKNIFKKYIKINEDFDLKFIKN